MIDVKVDTAGADTKVNRLVEIFGKKGFLNVIGEGLLAWVDGGFATGGYGRWAELSPVTIMRKGHNRILIQTGALRSSFRMSIRGDEVWIGTSDPKAIIHQFGQGRIPARPMLPREADARAIVKEGMTSLISEVQKAGA